MSVFFEKNNFIKRRYSIDCKIFSKKILFFLEKNEKKLRE
jgi:hypothetical protein